MSKILSFEFNEKIERLEVHGNIDGLLFLRDAIDDLIKMKNEDHFHLMVSSWGGVELSEEKQCLTNRLIPHVKFYKK